VRILDSAREHDVSDEDMLHALRHPLAVLEQDDDVSITLGPDYAGNLLEVGVVNLDEDPTVIHAMKMKPKYERFLDWR
jgi:hypothetical protein